MNSLHHSKKWIDLLEKIKVIGRPWISSFDQLEYLEAETQFLLPPEFKSFCQIFGSGQFMDTQVWIDCPHDDFVSYHAEKIERREVFLYDIEEKEENYNFLKSTYSFGLGADGFSICWDLCTFQESDQNYDIYIYDDWEKKKYRFGRSFYDFVVEVCLEKRIFGNILMGTESSKVSSLGQNTFLCLGETKG